MTLKVIEEDVNYQRFLPLTPLILSTTPSVLLEWNLDFFCLFNSE